MVLNRQQMVLAWGKEAYGWKGITFLFGEEQKGAINLLCFSISRN